MEMEDFKRPDHNDFSTASELAKKRFNGIRHNSISNDIEMWVMGEVVFSCSETERALAPGIWEKKFKDYFGLHEVQVIGKERKE